MYMEKPNYCGYDKIQLESVQIAKSIADKATFDVARCIVIGDKKVMERPLRSLGLTLRLM